MKSEVDRLALLLAASGLSDRTIRISLSEVERLGSEALLARVRLLRGTLIQGSGERASESLPKSHSKADAQREVFVDEAVHLLQEVEHLSARSAAERLRSAFAAKGVSLPPMRQREGLRNWLGRIARLTTSSELLHQVAQVRHSAVSSEKLDWPLRDRDK